MKTNWLIIGAGLSGATLAERLASEGNQKVVVVDRRNHIAGNAWDESNEHGILDHVYGPHIFHTKNSEVWNYLSNFTEWRTYFHKVLGSIDGSLVPLPFNFNTIEQLFPSALADRLISSLLADYGYGSRVPILSLLQTQSKDLQFLAEFVYEKVFEKYSLKQWGIRPENMSSSVSARVPVLASRDDRYFQDPYQAIPKQGYGAMVKNMLNHKNIHILLGAEWADVRGEISYDCLAFTGPIDEFFDFRHGPLPYRTLRFERETFATASVQNAAVVNYPNEYDFTRRTEVKKITGQNHEASTVISEFPGEHIPGQTIPYYPVQTRENRILYMKYRADAALLKPKTVFLGRLAEYMYYDMDHAVARALRTFKNIQSGLDPVEGLES